MNNPEILTNQPDDDDDETVSYDLIETPGLPDTAVLLECDRYVSTD